MVDLQREARRGREAQEDLTLFRNTYGHDSRSYSSDLCASMTKELYTRSEKKPEPWSG